MSVRFAIYLASVCRVWVTVGLEVAGAIFVEGAIRCRIIEPELARGVFHRIVSRVAR